MKKPLAGVFLAFVKRQIGGKEKKKPIGCPQDSIRDVFPCIGFFLMAWWRRSDSGVLLL
jgi:hypothetical protein